MGLSTNQDVAIMLGISSEDIEALADELDVPDDSWRPSDVAAARELLEDETEDDDFEDDDDDELEEEEDEDDE
jgi:hypothetical protein